ncbi:MAG TPA: RNA methyltransferase [Candidatus Bathyarchaeia archaeon]|nr:RNA methyltransferase [Candidatus Bathyarchaeia archaeon]
MANVSWERVKYTIALPASIVSDTPHLREKTAKLGTIARACSIFGVNEIVLYADQGAAAQQGEFALCELILRFMETPQYLRKRLFGINPLLRFTGILPPLQIPSHNVGQPNVDVKVGDLREGVVVGREGQYLRVDLGLGRPALCRGQLPNGSRLTVRLSKLEADLQGDLVDRSQIDIYWGYQVNARKSKLGTLLQERYELKIGTSHFGSSLMDCWSNVVESFRKGGSVLIVFGSPKQGIQNMLALEGKTPNELFDYFVNTIPGQNVSTVRTEEAVMITLGVLNIARLGK